MKKLFSPIIFLSLLLVGSFGYGATAKANYNYSIECPSTGGPYVLLVTAYNNVYETTGAPSFDPIPGVGVNEVCAPPNSSIKDLVEKKLLPQEYKGASIINTEMLECDDALIGGGSDKYDWDNNATFNAAYDKKITWQKVTSRQCIKAPTTRTVRIRYEIKGPALSNQFIYYIGPYDPATAQKNKGTNPEGVKQQCAIYKKSSDCNQNNQCYFASGFCYPQEIGKQKEKDAAAAIENEQNSNIVCSTVIKDTVSACAENPEACQAQCNKFSKCVYSDNACLEKSALSEEQLKTITGDAIDAYLKDKYPTPTGYLSKILPPCAFSGTCRSIQDLIILGINIAKFLFSIIGTIAFVMFVYGGFRMMLSMGNPDGVTHGKDAMVHAIIGIVISFSAYLIITFILNVFQVGSDFRAIGMIIKYFI